MPAPNRLHPPDVDPAVAADHQRTMLMTGSAPMDAERAFTQASRRRRREAAKRWLRRQPAPCGRLAVYGEALPATGAAPLGRGVREIPLDAIAGTVEPNRTTLFDGCFHPTKAARGRWERVWMAEHCGAVLPPMDLVRVG